MTWTDIWHITYLLVHAMVLYGLFQLLPSAPDRVQAGLLLLLISAFGFYIGGDILALFGIDFNPAAYKVASRVEHIAVLIYVFRLLHSHEDRVCRPISAPSKPLFH